eukprot:scaffold84824_cov39-Phaeocystis_antarctica.AAC.2
MSSAKGEQPQRWYRSTDSAVKRACVAPPAGDEPAPGRAPAARPPMPARMSCTGSGGGGASSPDIIICISISLCISLADSAAGRP